MCWDSLFLVQASVFHFSPNQHTLGILKKENQFFWHHQGHNGPHEQVVWLCTRENNSARMRLCRTCLTRNIRQLHCEYYAVWNFPPSFLRSVSQTHHLKLFGIMSPAPMEWYDLTSTKREENVQVQEKYTRATNWDLETLSQQISKTLEHKENHKN